MTEPRWTDITWIDLLGRPRAVRVLRERSGEPVEVPRSLVTAGYGDASVDDEVLLAVPDETSRRDLPWEDAPSVVMADLVELDGTPSPLCSRSALRRVLDKLAEVGCEMSAAAEFEFFLLDPATQRPIYDSIENYSITKGSAVESVMRLVRNDLRSMDIPVEASNPEYSGGQMEVNFTNGPALASADRATLLRAMVRRIARQQGLEATFMAKPWTDLAGSGMHVHQSLWRDGHNVFFEGGRLSSDGRSYVAGLLEHLAEFALFGCMTPNSYHRRSDYSFAPTVICWGSDNRTLAVRSIEDEEGSTRVEQRDASADCNVYLTFAGQFAAGLDGMQRSLEPPPPVTGNAYERKDLPLVPTTFLQAFDLMESGTAGHDVGEETVRAFLDVLRPEREVLIGSASDWERERYLSSL